VSYLSGKQPDVLIVSDDAEFARTIINRWQTERQVPAFTVMGGELWNGAVSAAADLAVAGPARDGSLPFLLRALETSASATVCLRSDQGTAHALRSAHPRVLFLSHHDGWVDALVPLCVEILRRVEAVDRAHQAEQAAAACQQLATLGRYMLDMRHSLNNALTSVLGNAELLLLEPAAFSAQLREQIDTIHTMALRMHEIVQRFSSLESEMKFAERRSQLSEGAASRAFVGSS